MSEKIILDDYIREIAEPLIEQKVVEIMRAIGIRGVERPPLEPLMDAVEVGRLLGRDVSTKETRRKAQQYVYHLRRIGALPYVELTKGDYKFDPRAIRDFIERGGNREPQLNEADKAA